LIEAEKMIVQIYEIQTCQEAERSIELGVDHIGSVLPSQDDWRQPSLKEAIRLSDNTSSRNSLIPLFQDRAILYKALDYYRPDYVHFCESLTDNRGRTLNLDRQVERQRRLKAKFPDIRIMRSIPIPPVSASSNFPSLAIARRLEPVSDLFLTDTWLGKEPVEGFIGITGRTCAWDTARALVVQSKIPVILAGGLSPGNVYQALLKAAPAGADSCTGTNAVDRTGEPVRFKKDFRKVAQFIGEVRRAEKDLKQKPSRELKDI
jgi:phosphoribosylanthranilate isomerase